MKKIGDRILPDDDPLLQELINLTSNSSISNSSLKILEIGCGDGSRLGWIKENLGSDCYGIDPSLLAVEKSCARGVNAKQGTADTLPYEDNMFDIVIFGFCLYLCDRDDLFCIASETNRILKSSGWLLIIDFYSSSATNNSYHHLNGIKSYKMDYRNVFTWHPSYECFSHQVTHHESGYFTDKPNEWIAISVLRKLA
jgi:ubiquinone/menaquinone biosynthesis C-methylase UbiE